MFRDHFWAVLVLLTLGIAPTASALTLEELDQAIDSRATTLDAFRQRLSDENPAKRRAAMEIMMKSDDPALVRMAKEAGLFAGDRAIRSVALKAILDSNPRLRVELAASREESMKGISNFVAGNGGSYYDKGGTFSFVVGDYSDKAKCWLESRGRECVVALAGETVSIFTGGFGGSFAATLTLNDEGLLVGPFQASYNGGGTGTATIDLTE